MVIRRRRTKRRCSVSFIFIRKYGKRRMPIDMLKRHCCGRLQQKIGEKRLGCSATRSVRQLHENSCRKGKRKRMNPEKKVK